MQELARLTDQRLLSNVHALLGTQRKLTAQLIAYLCEIEERGLHLKLACSSLFEFCTNRLKMSSGEAHRRIVAARLVRRFPLALELVASGAVHLSALELVSRYLNSENHAELLSAVSGKTKRAVEELLAERFPKPDAPATIRKLPELASGVTASLLERCARSVGEHGARDTSAQGAGEHGGLGASLQGAGEHGALAPSHRARIEPLSEARYKVQFTASRALKEKLERAQNLLSHTNPGRDLSVVIERAVDRLLDALERTKLGKADRPQRARAHHPKTVTRAVRRAVFARDGEQCSFVDEQGRRCPARAFLELDHIEERARGGGSGTRNVRVLCRAHNQFRAEQTFGRHHIERAMRLRREKQSEGRAVKPSHEAQSHEPEHAARFRQRSSAAATMETDHQTRAPKPREPAHFRQRNHAALSSEPNPRESIQEKTPPPSSNFRQRKQPEGGEFEAPTANASATDRASDNGEIGAKLLSALTRLGFHKRRAQFAIEQVQGRAATQGQAGLAELVRACILRLTE